MPSQDRKQLKKEELESEDEDNKCLGSMLRRDKVNESTPSGTANSKVLHNVKKEECQDSGTPQKKLVNSSSKSVKVKKVDKIEYDSDSDSDDDKPISRKSVSKNTKASNVKKEEAKDSDSPQKKPVHSSSKSLKVKKVDKFECGYDDDKRISRKTISKNTEVLVEKKTSEVKKRTKSERKVYDLPGQKRDPPEERDSVRIFYESLYNQVPDSEMAAIWMMESGLLPEEEARKVLDRKQKKNPLQKLGSLVKVITSTTKRSAESASKFTTVMKERKSTATTTTLNTSNKKNDTASGSNTVNKSKKRKKSGSSSEEEDSDGDFVISIVAKRQKAR